MVMNYTIRPAAQRDVPGIANVAFHTWNITYAQTVAPHNRQKFLAQAYAPQALHDAIAQAHSWFYVAAQGRRVVGFAQFVRRCDTLSMADEASSIPDGAPSTPNGAQAELVRIYVHPDHQRRGIGQALLGVGLAAMAVTGISHCYVSAEIGNAAARAFYERFGFRPQREYGHFLGDQIIRLVEYVAPIASLLDLPDMKRIIEKVVEHM